MLVTLERTERNLKKAPGAANASVDLFVTNDERL